MAEGLRFEERASCGLLSQKGGFAKEVKILSWNGRPAKLDIRIWRAGEGGPVAGKGVTLDRGEAEALLDILSGLDMSSISG